MQHTRLLLAAGVLLAAAAGLLPRPAALQAQDAGYGRGSGIPSPASAASAEVLAEGRFHGVAHEGRGTATVHRLTDGKRLLRLTEFETENGPDLYVYLVAAEDTKDSDTVKKADFVSLGKLKGNKGNQNYELPTDLDLAKFRSVAIWCRRFSVNFAAAPLAPPANGRENEDEMQNKGGA